jgi:hypothetical protein
MKSKVKAALLSGLVFPGIGQYYLGRRTRGLLFLAPAAIGGLLYMNGMLDEANALAGQLMSGKLGLDPAAIEAGIEAHPTPLATSVSGIVFVVCWVGSVLEALLAKP